MSPENILTERCIKAAIPSTQQMYLIAQMAHNDDTVEMVRNVADSGDLEMLSLTASVDIHEDIVEVYIVIDQENIAYIVGIIDPYELYMDPYIIAQSAGFEVSPEYLFELRKRLGPDPNKRSM